MIKILGISAFFHDSSAALIIDGEIINAVQEERFTRIKHDPSFPTKSIKFILNENMKKYFLQAFTNYEILSIYI